jgi:hypothetical protein
MHQGEVEAAKQIMVIALLVANAIVYLLFFLLAALLNRIKGRQVVARRSAGNIGLLLLFLALFFTAVVRMTPSLPADSGTMELSLFRGEHIGYAAGTFAFPALLVSFVLSLLGGRSKP